MTEKRLSWEDYIEYKIKEKIFQKGLEVGLPTRVLDNYEEIIRMTADEIKQRIKSACELWWKFRDDPSVFFALYPKYYEVWEKDYPLTDPLDNLKLWEEWLFKLAFKDVLGDEK